MKFFFWGLCICLTFSDQTLARVSEPLPQWKRTSRLPLDLTNEEYAILAQNLSLRPQFDDPENTQLQDILRVGKRNLDWVNLINSVRPKDQQILLSSKETQTGSPMDLPTEYNAAIIIAKYKAELSSMPPTQEQIVVGLNSLPQTPPVDDQTFTTHARELNKWYQMTTRWLLLSQYLDDYKKNRTGDVRGFYFLSHKIDRQTVLKTYSQLGAGDRIEIANWLLEMCFNIEGDDQKCSDEMSNTLAADNDLNPFYEKYAGPNQNIFNSYFEIQKKHAGVTHQTTGTLQAFAIPFIDPLNSDTLHFVRDNIEDEWHGDGWKLTLDVVTQDSNAFHIQFIPGTLPHANAIAGDAIVMDQNVSLSDYNNNWTIKAAVWKLLRLANRSSFGGLLPLPEFQIRNRLAIKGTIKFYY